jgi:tripeptidyl-peptidase-1
LNYPTPIIYYQTAGIPPINLSLQIISDDSEPYLQWPTYTLSLNETSLPQVISTSYADKEQTLVISYAKTICNLFAQLAARGVSYLFATGDSGLGEISIPNNGKNTIKFLPIFPASCPFVTAVGATQHIEPEIGVSFSGGGFSDYFPRPGYQDVAVKKYLEEYGKEWTPYFNSSGRAYPDVSAQGTNVSIIYWGGHRYEAGTSCSTTIFASVISLINADCLGRGTKALGFLNLWLYSVAGEELRDVVAGRSSGCASTYPEANITSTGWGVVVGWDLATGLGMPDFKKLLAVSREGGGY